MRIWVIWYFLRSEQVIHESQKVMKLELEEREVFPNPVTSL